MPLLIALALFTSLPASADAHADACRRLAGEIRRVEADARRAEREISRMAAAVLWRRARELRLMYGANNCR